MKLKKFLSLTLVIASVLVMGFTPAYAAVSSQSLSVGKGGSCVVIPATGTVGAVVTLGNGSVNKDMTSSEHMTAGKKAAGSGTVLASVNGAFFNAYYDSKKGISFPGNCPLTYGVVIKDGQSVKGAGSSVPLLGFTSDGKALIDNVRVDVNVTFRRNVKLGVFGVNDYNPGSWRVYLITPECGYPVTLGAGSVVVHLKNDMVTAIDFGLKTIECLPDENIVIYDKEYWDGACKWGNQPQVGNSAQIDTVLTPSRTADQSKWDNVVTAIGATPWLLQDGKDVFDVFPPSEAKMGRTFSAQRTFAAILSDGSLMIGETSGTFDAIIAYLKSIGAVDALALDGGGSSTLNVGGKDVQPAGRKLSNVLHIVDYGSAAALPKKYINTDLVTPSGWFVSGNFFETASGYGLVPDGFDMAAKQNITRAEFCQLAYTYVSRVLGPEELTKRLNASGMKYEDAAAAFDDIGNNYKNIIVQSYRLGICGGKGNGKFDPFGSITREQAAAMLTNTANIVGIQATGQPFDFADASTFSSYAPTFIDFVYRAGIMSGTGRGNFSPKGYFTKEQSVTTFVNMIPNE